MDLSFSSFSQEQNFLFRFSLTFLCAVTSQEWIVSEYCARQRGSRKSGDDAITSLESPVCPVMMQLLPESSSLDKKRAINV
jgi:hypothetical protein